MKKKKINSVYIISLTEIFLCVIAIIVSSFLFASSNQNLKENEISSINNYKEDYVNRLDNFFIKMQQVSYKIASQNDTQLLMNYYYDKTGDNYGKIEALNTTNDYLDNYVMISPLVSFVGAKFKEEGEYSYPILHSSSTTSGSNVTMDELLNSESFYSDNFSLKIRNDSLFYVFGSDSEDTLKIAVQLNAGEFSEFFDTKSDRNTSFSNYYFHNDQLLLSFSNYEVDENTILNENQKDYKTAKYYTTYVKYNNVLCMRLSLNLTNLNNNGLVSVLYFILSVLAIVIVTILTLVVTGNYMKKPIYELQKALNEISKGNFKYQITYKTKTDMQELFDGFNNMSSLLNDYIDKTYINEIRVKDANFKVLQSQIHPHFLYNCFATIQSLITIEDYSKASELTKQLSLYYSYVTKNKSIIVSLKEEWDHMYRYLKIQKIRFADNVEYEIDELDESLFNYQVPKLIFQPIVENSFKYAFKNIDNGILKIKITSDDDHFYVSFEDNGQVSLEEIDSLNKKIYEQDVETSGLINVCQRIISYSQNHSHVLISQSETLKGLKITFVFKK